MWLTSIKRKFSDVLHHSTLPLSISLPFDPRQQSFIFVHQGCKALYMLKSTSLQSCNWVQSSFYFQLMDYWFSLKLTFLHKNDFLQMIATFFLLLNSIGKSSSEMKKENVRLSRFVHALYELAVDHFLCDILYYCRYFNEIICWKPTLYQLFHSI